MCGLVRRRGEMRMFFDERSSADNDPPGERVSRGRRSIGFACGEVAELCGGHLHRERLAFLRPRGERDGGEILPIGKVRDMKRSGAVRARTRSDITGCRGDRN